MTPDISKIVNTELVTIDSVELPALIGRQIEADVLRLDKMHPVISGNKWFKLRYYLLEAVIQNRNSLLTFGGAYSNHVVATACGANHAGLKSVGIIRGERPMNLSYTLQIAEHYGMQLKFITREEYKRKNEPEFLNTLSKEFPGSYIVPEGGSGTAGIKGSEEIISLAKKNKYSHILCAIGTGTMYIGLANGSDMQQQVIGICVLKGMTDLLNRYKKWLNDPQKLNYCRINYNYHFGGYARKNHELTYFMNQLYSKTGIPTDFVYTGKLFYAVTDLINKNYFPPRSKLLLIHSGGLQGNLSLPDGTLNF